MGEEQYRNIPETGTVEKVRLRWMVKEDGALAHHLQTQEFDDHFCGNRQRNGYAYKDYSLAKSEQFMEEKMFAKKASDRNMLFEKEEEEKIAEELATGGTRHVQIQCEPTFELPNWPEKELVGLHQMSISDANNLPQFKYSNSQDISGHFLKSGTPTVGIRHEKTTQTEPLATNSINVSHYDIDVYDVHNHPPVHKPCEQDSEQEEEDEKLAMKLQIQEVVEHDRLIHNHQQCPAPASKPDDVQVCQQEEEDAELAIRLQIQEVSSQEAIERDRLLALKTQNEELANLL